MVKVTITRDSTGGAKIVEEHSTGRAFLVRDGHLGILDGLNQSAEHVAVYAPGQWLAAVVEP